MEEQRSPRWLPSPKVALYSSLALLAIAFVSRVAHEALTPRIVITEFSVTPELAELGYTGPLFTAELADQLYHFASDSRSDRRFYNQGALVISRGEHTTPPMVVKNNFIADLLSAVQVLLPARTTRVEGHATRVGESVEVVVWVDSLPIRQRISIADGSLVDLSDALGVASRQVYLSRDPALASIHDWLRAKSDDETIGSIEARCSTSIRSTLANDNPRDDAIAFHVWALALCSDGREDDAIRKMRQSIAADRRYWPAYNSMGLALEGHGKPKEALIFYGRGLSYKWDSPHLLANLGALLCRTFGRCREALTYLDNASRVDPGRADIQHNLGEILFQLRRFEDAREAFERAAMASDLPYPSAESLLRADLSGMMVEPSFILLNQMGDAALTRFGSSIGPEEAPAALRQQLHFIDVWHKLLGTSQFEEVERSVVDQQIEKLGWLQSGLLDDCLLAADSLLAKCQCHEATASFNVATDVVAGCEQIKSEGHPVWCSP